MPRINPHIPTLTELSLDALNDMVIKLNETLEHFSLLESELRGEDSYSPSFNAAVNLNSNRLRNVARSQEGTDAINRDEAKQLINEFFSQFSENNIRKILSLTDSSGGTASNTLAAITGGGTACENATKNAIASLAQTVNEIANFLRILNNALIKK